MYLGIYFRKEKDWKHLQIWDEMMECIDLLWGRQEVLCPTTKHLWNLIKGRWEVRCLWDYFRLSHSLQWSLYSDMYLQSCLDENEKGEWKSLLKAQHSENQDDGIQSHHFMGNRWGTSGNSGWLNFGGVQKSLQMVTAAMILKDAYSLEGKLWPT